MPIPAGQKLTPDRLNGLLPLMAQKSSDTSRASTTTMTNDPDLQVTVVANGIYSVEGLILVSCATTTPDLKIGWFGPSGATLPNWNTMWNNTGNSVAAATDTAISTTRVIALDAAGFQHLRFAAVLRVSSTAGTFAFQWAQGTSDATAVVVRANSWLRLFQMA